MTFLTADAASQDGIELRDEFRATLQPDPATGELPLYVPNDMPGYKPAYWGHEAQEVNLVLEGGSMRVQFTAGVLDFLSDVGFFAKNIIGVSAGALSGFNYLMGERGRTSILNIAFTGDKNYMSLWSYITSGNAFNVDMSFREIPFNLMPYTIDEFTESPCNLTAVATNLVTNKAHYFPVDDPIASMSYMQASAAMPFVSQPVMIDGQPYLDGGVADTLPVDYSLSTGVKKQVVVLTRERGFSQKPRIGNNYAFIKYRDYPEFAKAVTMRYDLVNRSHKHCWELADQGRVFVIAPSEPLLLSILENNPIKLYEVYEMGYEQARRQWRDLQRYMDE